MTLLAVLNFDDVLAKRVHDRKSQRGTREML